MKQIYTLFLLFFTLVSCSQKADFNIQKKAVAEGYDVVSYFSNTAVKGKKNYATKYQDATFLFSSQENLDTFLASPEKYVPQYGGYCAYAIAVKSEKVSIDPKTFEIRDGKLYLFYNSWGMNTLELWLKEKPENLKQKADKNWCAIKN